MLPTSHLYVLLVLAESESHGYAIMRETERVTAGRVTLGPGALYAALGRLLEDGLIVEAEERPAPELDDARRRYYQITNAGRAALGAELSRFDSVLQRARQAGLGWSSS